MTIFHSCKMEGYAFSTRLAVLAGMLLAVLLSCVVCPVKFGLNGVKSNRPSGIGTPVGQVTPAYDNTPLGYRHYPARNFVMYLMYLAFFMDVKPEPYGDDFTLVPQRTSWTRPVEYGPDICQLFGPSSILRLIHKIEENGSGRNVKLRLSQWNDPNEMAEEGELKTMSKKYSSLMELHLFVFRQRRATCDDELEVACSEFPRYINWSKKKERCS
eukprot:GHVS01100366.1.p1 GENE.GHVS01100366.1~~GHVS01100366.1.p1  ORF type:complete len:214 (-),score=5.25 GHVS01100366.1:41-682(-)